MKASQAKAPAAKALKAISGHTRLVAILGWPLTYTLSPAFQNATLRRHGVDACYLALPTGDARSFRALLKALMESPNFVGANVTNPYKIEAARLCPKLSPEAKAIGAVNTLVRSPKGAWVGHNTDAFGFSEALASEGVALKGARVLVLGAGGAARAAVWASAQAGARRVLVLARRRAQAQETALLAGAKGLSGELDPGTAGLASLGADVTVNALPGEGLGGTYGAALARRARSRAVAFDLSYTPPRTAFLKEAALRGWRPVTGLGMLADQGRAAFELWFGVRPERAAVLGALIRALPAA
jgi:shikimate dehydrogenase